MKTKLLSLALAAMFMSVVMAGCGGGKKSSSQKWDGPEWVIKPGVYEDAIVAAGIGVALKEKTAKNKADLNGRKKIAETLQSQIKNMATSFVEEASAVVSVSTDEGELFSSEDASNEYFQEITQSVTKQTLEGAMIEEYWPPLGMKEGNKIKYYAKVVLKKNSVVDAFKNKVKKDIKSKESKLPDKLKAKTDDALKALDKAIEKWEASN